MAIHKFDHQREAQPSAPKDMPYRLCRFGPAGEIDFYWAGAPGLYAAYWARNRAGIWRGIWGRLDCASGKRMKPQHRVFIADLSEIMRLQDAMIFRPCAKCCPREYRIWREGQAD